MSRSWSRWKKILNYRRGLIWQMTIVLSWLTMIGLLVERTFLKPAAIKITPVLARERLKVGENWWGIYWKGEKIGYAVTAQEQQAEKVSMAEKVWLKLNVLGIPQNIEQTLNYHLHPDLTLNSFSFSLKSGLLQFRLAGRIEDRTSGAGKQLSFQVHSGGKERTQEIFLKEAPYILSQAKPYLLSQGLEVGKKYLIPAFDPATLSTAMMTAEVLGVERLNIGGDERVLYRVGEEFRGIVVKSWIDGQGEIWKEESPLGFMLIRESKDAAMHKNWNPAKIVDLIALTAIPVNRQIEDPREAYYLRAKLLSSALGGLKIEGDRQVRQGNEVVVRKEKFPPPPSEYKTISPEELKMALRPTPFIQSDDPEIKRQAAAIVKGVEDPAEKVRRLAAWVYGELEKRPVVSIPSAVEVLRQKAGDCNEHAVLFTALARAVGIPAEIQAGIIYQEGNFFYHAWVKVHLGSWISVDPLLNQVPADATHIRLVEGDLDQQMDIVKVIGRLKVEILEVR
ncbi:MAG: transglutaminase domain-containing protein [Deltaproteobacteria bacterium]|nr:transglutaminase domain-containing protein [Deltaproteobacteria bacterium]